VTELSLLLPLALPSRREVWEGDPGFWEREETLHWGKMFRDKGHKAVGNQASLLLVHME